MRRRVVLSGVMMPLCVVRITPFPCRPHGIGKVCYTEVEPNRKGRERRFLETKKQSKKGTVMPLPRYRRATGEVADALPRLLLQERDFALLHDIARYRLLTTSQIEILRQSDTRHALRFPSRLTLTRRLKLLFHHGYVQRIARPLSQGSLEPVYLLDAQGVKTLQRHLFDQGRDDTGIKPKTALPKAVALEHLLSVNQFRFSLEIACAATIYGSVHGSDAERRELVQWRSGDAVKFAVPIAVPGERTQTVRLIPDGFFAVRTRGQRLFYFLEADRGTESLPVLAAKCRAYYAYWQSGGFGRDFSLSAQVAFRVVFVLHSQRRLEAMGKVVASLPNGQRMFWFATEDEIVPHRVLEPVFHEVGSKQRRALG